MNKLIKAILSIIIFTAGSLHAAELQIQLYNSPAEGTLIFQVYNSADTFGDFRSPVEEITISINAEGKYTIPEVVDGTIAVMAYYDENQNGKLDRNFIGIPRESIAISNNYRPKGPPNFGPASFSLGAMDSRQLDMEMYQILGKRGQIGVGIGVIAKTTPYLNSKQSAYQVIPAISYLGERLQIFGPNLQFGLMGSGNFRLALSATYRIASYDEDDSVSLADLGDRKSTFMAGPSLIYEWQNGIEVEANYHHDIVDKIGGGIAEIGLSKGFQLGAIRINPGLSLTWLSKKISNHDFGVPVTAVTSERPAYAAGSVFIPGIDVSSFIELSEKWQLIVNVKGELLPGGVTSSPIVDDDLIFSGNAILAYIF
ncbi:MAG: DUF2141 domain-containing protein [Gammaproteobacteria bacterium]|nr:DUF2141 domain-containing protein [Gammaproteobacteria bacterium]